MANPTSDTTCIAFVDKGDIQFYTDEGQKVKVYHLQTNKKVQDAYQYISNLLFKSSPPPVNCVKLMLDTWSTGELKSRSIKVMFSTKANPSDQEWTAGKLQVKEHALEELEMMILGIEIQEIAKSHFPMVKNFICSHDDAAKKNYAQQILDRAIEDLNAKPQSGPGSRTHHSNTIQKS